MLFRKLRCLCCNKDDRLHYGMIPVVFIPGGVTNNAINLTENEEVQFITEDAVAELRRIKEDGDGTVVAYGEEIGTLLLDNGLADEITVTTVSILVGGDEKALACGLNDGRTWIVRSNKVLVDGKMRTVHGKV